MRALALVAALGLAGAPARAQQAAHPDVGVMIDQAALELPGILDAERKALNGKIKDFALDIHADGLHAKGEYQVPVIGGVHFEAVVGFVWTGPNLFEVRVRRVKVFLFNVTGLVLDTVQSRLDAALQGVCAFKKLGEQSDGSHALRATVNMAKLMPAFPGLVFSGIETRERILILKARLPS